MLSPPSRGSGLGLIAGPLFLAAGWLVLALMVEEGPGLGWTLSHVLLLLGVGFLLPGVLSLGSLLRDTQAKNWGVAGTTLTLVGILTLTGQYAIDLAGAQLASGEEGGMTAVFGRILSAPVVALPFYDLGPILLPIGLLVLVVGLIKSRAAPPGAAGLTVLGIVVAGIGRVMGSDWVTLVGFVVVFVGLAPIGWAMLNRAGARP